MALTRDFRETILERVKKDSEFKEALFTEAVTALLEGDLETGKALLRNYINATIGFEQLSQKTGTPSKSLMRMLSPSGNPAAKNIFAIIHELQNDTRIKIEVMAA